MAGACLLVGSTVLFAGALVFRSDAAYSPLWDLWVGNLPLVLAVLACFARAVAGGPRRTAAVWLGVGMLSFTVGNLIYLMWTQFQADPPVPSPSDLGYLGIVPCVGAAVVSLVRRSDGSQARSLWLDGLLGAAGGATALAAVLSPVLSGVEGDIVHVLVGAAFPVADLLLVAMICGLLAVRGARGGSLWVWLVVGLLVFCAADVIYALRLVNDTYVVGTVLDALWALALTVMALAIWRPERPRAISTGRSAAILAVPMLATLAAVVVLIVSSFSRLSVVVIALAALTLLLAVARTFVAFRQVQRLSDARRQAVTDELTGLGNRRSLFEHGGQRLQADRGHRFALILIDLDNFKEINDTLGHPAGDEILREIARRLAARVGHDDLLVRLGGDEFAILVTLAAGEDECRVAEQILDRITRPLVIQGVPIRVGASAGVAPRHDTADIASLLRRSDVAMYAAKHDRSRVRLYEPQLDEANRTRVEMVQSLEAALAQRQFVLHYQPVLDIESGATIGAEALVRWQHPTRGLLYPDAFLPVVEQSGLMGVLTGVVLEAAIAQLASWRRAGLDTAVAVNLSASDLLDLGLAERIAGLLADHAVPVSALTLEITESVIMTDPERAHQVLTGLRRLGLRIAVDDYGTGYCALAYLRDLPVDELKIDRSFIAEIDTEPRTAAIVQSTIDLAHVLGLHVVAEGIEHRTTLEILAHLGCDFGQGYLFGHPLPADEFLTWTRAHTLAPATTKHAD